MKNAFKDLKKSKLLIRGMVSFTKKTGVCATLQTLELMVPILGKVNVTLSGKEKHAMLMMKVDGQDGFDAILGNKSKSVKPIEGYDTEISVGNEKYYCVADPKISLDIAFQKIFALRGLHDVGLVYGDVKIENVMIQKENDKYTVRLIDIGSIIKKDTIDFICTPYTAAPEGFVGGNFSEKYVANPKFDVFANAVDLPYIFFGGVAKKHLAREFKDKDMPKIFSKMKSSFERISHRFEKWGQLKTLFMFIFFSKEYEEHKKNETFDYVFNGRHTRLKNEFYISDIFSAYEYADNDDVEETLKEYEQDGFEKPNFSSPNFPENMTNAQKMRYMYWHLGFLKTNRDIESGTGKNEEKGKGVYPTEVIHSLSLLQMYSTDPNPEKRISSRAIERVLLHLKMTVDQWKDGQYRIVNENGLISGDGLSPEEWEMVDIILPKNEANKKNKS